MPDKKYKSAGLFYLIGNLFNKGIAFLTVPIFTRILSTTDYGIVTTYNSWVAILTMVMGFAIYMGIRAAFIDYGDCIEDFMAVATTFTLMSGMIVCLTVGGVCFFLHIRFRYVIVIFCLLQGLGAALIQNYSMYLMMRFQFKLRTALMILPNFISVILSVVIIHFLLHSDFYLGRIIPTALVHAGFGLMTVLLVYRKSHLLYNKSYLMYALKISMPLVLHGIALNILSQSDRTMISWLANTSQTGIYSLIYNFGMIATVITTAFDGVWVPWFVDRLKDRDICHINELAIYYINLMSYAMITVILIGPEIIKILAPEKYWEGISIIPPIVLANYVIFGYTLYVNIEHFHKRTTYITLNTLTAALSNLLLNYIFIRKYGYVAAAYTTLASYLLAFVMHSFYAKKIEPDLYPLKCFAKSSVNLILSVVLFYVFKNQWMVRWVVMAVCILIVCLHEKERLLKLFPLMKKISNRKSRR